MSRILRRSGNAVCQFCEKIEWEPGIVVMVGVGNHHHEVDVMRETWNADSFLLFGFEPNPSIYRNIRSTFPGMIYNRAVTNFNGKTDLFVKNKHKDGSSLYRPHKTEDVKKVTVKTTTLDEFDRNILSDIDGVEPLAQGLLWLDCEGSELPALEGAEDFIKRVSMVNVEITGIPWGKGWSPPIDIHRWLTRHGFLQAWVHTTRVNAGQFDAIYVSRELFRPEFCSCLNSLEGWNDGQEEG